MRRVKRDKRSVTFHKVELLSFKQPVIDWHEHQRAESASDHIESGLDYDLNSFDQIKSQNEFHKSDTTIKHTGIQKGMKININFERQNTN